MIMKLTRRIKWSAALAVLTGFVAFVVMRPEVIDVDVGVVETGPLTVTVDEDGVTRLREHTTIAAPVHGRLLAVAIRAGDTVTRGQVLARIAATPLDERERFRAEAAVAAARAVRRQAESRTQQAEVLLDQARRERRRADRLSAAGAMAQSAVELAQNEERIRERDLDAAKSAADAAVQAERQARSVLLGTGARSAEGIVDVRSPLSGRVLRVIEEHERVLAAGTPIIEVGSPEQIDIEVDVLSTDATRIQSGARMIVHVPGGPDLEAVVTRVEPAAFTRVSPLGVEEQRVNVIARFLERPTGFGDRFRVATSIVLWSAESVLTIPSSSLVPSDEGWAVYVVERGRARLQSIETGQRGARLVEVRAGLSAGTTIVLHPDERINNGVRVATR
jgi:HlyD family secretion protein